MQRFSHKASSVLEKKNFKCFFPYKCIGKQMSQMIYAKIQPQGILGSGEEDF